MKKRFVLGLSLLSWILLLISCTNKVACLNPPPTLTFAVVDASNASIITQGNSGTVKLYSVSTTGAKSYVNDLRINEQSTSSPYLYYASTYELITAAHQSNVTSFTLEIGGQAVGSIQVKTYKNNSDCDGWVHASQVNFNQKPVTASNELVQYLFKVD